MTLLIAELAEPLFRHRGELGRIADGADRDDAALTGHEPRHRGDRAEAARVGERHGRAGEVVGHEAVGARLLDQRLVGRVERGEVHRVGALDHRHDEAAAAVLPLHVHREARARCPRAPPGRACRPGSTSVWPMTGCCFVAWTSANAMRWVNEILPGFPAAWSAWLSRAPLLLQHADRQHPERGGRRAPSGSRSCWRRAWRRDP